jgi:parallel beta-helix repeat protein
MRAFAAASAAAVVLALCARSAGADTLTVPSDDFPTIQSAVDAAGEGDVVLVGPGTYVETVNVNLKTDLEIRGRGWPLIQPPAGPGFDIYGANTGLLVQGFAIDGASYGVSVSDGADLRFVKLLITGSTEDGIILEGADGVVISKCEVTGSTNHGIQDFGSAGLVIEKCSLEGNLGDSMRLSIAEGGNGGSNGAVVTKNRVTGGDAGIRFAGEDAEISKNRIEGWGEYGIEVVSGTSSDGLVVTKNRISGGGGAVGLKVNVGPTTVTKNVLDGGAIFLSGGFHVVDANKVSNATWGVYSDGTDCTISGNRLTALQAFGIRANGSEAVVTGNRLAGVNGNGIEIAGGGSIIEGNRVSGATGNGFDVTGTGCTLTGNRASGSGGFDLRDHNVPGVNTYEGNRFGTESIGSD